MICTYICLCIYIYKYVIWYEMTKGRCNKINVAATRSSLLQQDQSCCNKDCV